jgi:hypothetical protein
MTGGIRRSANGRHRPSELGGDIRASNAGPRRAPIAGRDIRLGSGSLDLVAASRDGKRYRTVVNAGRVLARQLWIGHTLPRDATVRSVTLDGRRAGWKARMTNRGLEVTVEAEPGDHNLVVEVR